MRVAEKVDNVKEIVVTKPSERMFVVPKDVRDWWNGKEVERAELRVDPKIFTIIYTSDTDVHFAVTEPEECSCEIVEEQDGTRLRSREVRCGYKGQKW